MPELIPNGKISEELKDIRASRDPKRFHAFCEETGYNPQDQLEEDLLERYFLDADFTKRNLQKDSLEKIQVRPSPYQRAKSQGPLVLLCLGGGSPENTFLENQRYVVEMISPTLGKIYPYLNFSETLSIIDKFSEFKKVLPSMEIYEALYHINAQFFPELNGRRHDFSEMQISRLKKLDVYHGRNLAQRVETIPEILKERFRRNIISPSPVEIITGVPFIKRRGFGRVYAERRALEISGIINKFQSEYFPEFC